MPDYQNGKIYKIYCNITEEVYYGSTTVPLCKRMSGHRSNYAICLEGGKRSTCKSFAILGRGDYSYSLVEDCPCNSKEQLFARERFYIQNNYCVNKCVPGRTAKEWREDNKEVIIEKQKQYRETHKKEIAEYYQNNKEKIAERDKAFYQNNKEKIAERDKAYYQNNKEMISEKRKEKIRCECCICEVTKRDWGKHIKTKKHQKNSK